MNLIKIYKKLNDVEIANIIAYHAYVKNKPLHISVLPFLEIQEAVNIIFQMVEMYGRQCNATYMIDDIAWTRAFNSRKRLLRLLAKLMLHWGAVYKRCANGDIEWTKNHPLSDYAYSQQSFRVSRCKGELDRDLPKLKRIRTKGNNRLLEQNL